MKLMHAKNKVQIEKKKNFPFNNVSNICLNITAHWYGTLKANEDMCKNMLVRCCL